MPVKNGSGRTLTQINHNQVADAGARVATMTQVLAQLVLDGNANPSKNGIHGNSLLGACCPENVAIGEFPFSFVH